MKKIITHREIKKDIKSLDQLSSLIGIDKNIFTKALRTASSLYRQIILLKKDCGTRTINAPKPNLKLIQRNILDKIFSDIKLPTCVYGLSRSRTIIENARRHSSSDYLLNLDIKSFFPNVHFEKVKQIYKDIGLNMISEDLCKLTTLDHKLPQGSPTSPFLASFALTNLDYRLMGVAKSNSLIYTRYFDDICFSGSRRVKTMEKSIIKIINEEGYNIKKTKRQFFEKGDQKEINGILVEKNKLSLKNTDDLFRYLENLKNNGLSTLNTDNPTKEHDSLMGKVSFLKLINKEQGEKAERVFNAIKW